MGQGGDADPDESVLTPEELDIEEREEVASIGEGRYVVGADGSPDAPDQQAEDDSSSDASTGASERENASTDGAKGDGSGVQASGESDAGTGDAAITGRDVKRWLAAELAEHDSEYAYRIAAKSGHSVSHQQLATDDISTAFDGLLVWYAQQVAAGTPVDEALGILLAESSVQVRYPTERLIAYLEDHDVDPEDSVADLVETVSEEDGLAFPRRR